RAEARADTARGFPHHVEIKRHLERVRNQARQLAVVRIDQTLRHAACGGIKRVCRRRPSTAEIALEVSLGKNALVAGLATPVALHAAELLQPPLNAGLTQRILNYGG